MGLRVRVGIVCAAIVATAGFGISADDEQGRQGGGPRNLQVLPKDWTGQQVQQFMRNVVARGLGVQCTHCHVQDRASDEKPQKVTARKMLQMMMTLNEQHLKDVGDPAVAQKVTCYTCHRGTTKPLTAPPDGGGAGW
jgi:hypothetical protein